EARGRASTLRLWTLTVPAVSVKSLIGLVAASATISTFSPWRRSSWRATRNLKYARSAAVDAVFSGPATHTFPEFVRHIIENNLTAVNSIPGMLTKANVSEPRFAQAIGERSHCTFCGLNV